MFKGLQNLIDAANKYHWSPTEFSLIRWQDAIITVKMLGVDRDTETKQSVFAIAGGTYQIRQQLQSLGAEWDAEQRVYIMRCDFDSNETPEQRMATVEAPAKVYAHREFSLWIQSMHKLAQSRPESYHAQTWVMCDAYRRVFMDAVDSGDIARDELVEGKTIKYWIDFSPSLYLDSLKDPNYKDSARAKALRAMTSLAPTGKYADANFQAMWADIV